MLHCTVCVGVCVYMQLCRRAHMYYEVFRCVRECVCVRVGGCMDSCPLSGFFLQLKIAMSIRGRRARPVTMATAVYLSAVILMCRTGRLFRSYVKMRELSFRAPLPPALWPRGARQER